MGTGRILIFIALAAILGVPFAMRPASDRSGGLLDAPSIVVVTPHVPQIRQEFSEAFDRWHMRTHGSHARIDWRVPGGTSEIMKQLEAQYHAAAKAGRIDFTDPKNPTIEPGALSTDIMFGGGTYEHGRLKTGIKVLPEKVEGEAVALAEPTKDGRTGQLAFTRDGKNRGRAVQPGSVRIRFKDAATGESREARDEGRNGKLILRTPSGDQDIGRVDYREGKLSIANAALESVSAAYSTERSLALSFPAGFEQSRMDEWFGANTVGAGTLYDPDQYWIGTALSGFGIVYNKELFRRIYPDRADPFPKSFEDLADPALIGMVTLADPRQSGSVTTTFEAILNFYGWDRGWKLLREMCANTRSFTNSSPKTPLDVAQGEAAAGLTIDFYGRGQGQAVVKPGEELETSRVGYVDPKGSTYVDADPVTILRGGPNFELSRRFVEFTLTEEAQALWQFHVPSHPKSAANPKDAGGEPMGPRHSELRRMPVRRVMYEKYASVMIDRLEPFEVASTVKPAGWRSSIGLMMGAFSVDIAHQHREAWAALNRARRAAGFPAPVLAEMETLFYAWPTTTVNGKELVFSAENYRAVRESWTAAGAQQRAEVAYTTFFRSNYDRILELERSNRPK